MTKQLYVAYVTEGTTDEIFLGTIIRRTLEAIARKNNGAFDVEMITWLGSAKGPTTVATAQAALPAGAQLLFIHRDTDNHSVEFIYQKHVSPVINALGKDFTDQVSIVPLIIRHEQETWLFADLDQLSEVLGGQLDRTKLNLPPNIEDRSKAKELFKATIREANVGQRCGRGFKPDAVAAQLAEEIRLKRL